MNKFQIFLQSVQEYNMESSTGDFLVNLLLTGLLSYLVVRFYLRFGSPVSNKKLFSRTFIVLALTTMLVITIVKSSLALSLGLVGALSIVRFRTAVKEPEELAFLFFNIAIGVGFGAGQRVITLMGGIVIMIVLALYGIKRSNRDIKGDESILLTVCSKKPGEIDVDSLVDVISGHCDSLKLKRMEQSEEIFEATFIADFESFEQVSKGKDVLLEKFPSVRLSIFTDPGVIL